jgi:hypothetical protein
LAAKGVRTAMPTRSKPYRVPKAMILSYKEMDKVRHIELEIKVLERQIENRKEMLHRLDEVYKNAEAMGDVLLAKKASLLQREMMMDLERHIDKLHNDVNIVQHRHGNERVFGKVSNNIAELALDYNALVMKYG